MNKQKACANKRYTELAGMSIRADLVKPIVRHYDDKPVFLLKFFQCEDYCKEAMIGKFWASSVESFRNNNDEGRGDGNESEAPNFAYFVSNNTPPTSIREDELKYLIPKGKIDAISLCTEKFSLISFSGIHIKDCVVCRTDDGDDLLVCEIGRIIKEFGEHFCVYYYETFKDGFNKFNERFPSAVFERVNYRKIENGVSISLLEWCKKSHLWKNDEFSYQNEWRIVFPYKFPNEKDRHIQLEVKAIQKMEIKTDGTSSVWFGCKMDKDVVSDYISPFVK